MAWATAQFLHSASPLTGEPLYVQYVVTAQKREEKFEEWPSESSLSASPNMVDKFEEG